MNPKTIKQIVDDLEIMDIEMRLDAIERQLDALELRTENEYSGG